MARGGHHSSGSHSGSHHSSGSSHSSHSSSRSYHSSYSHGSHSYHGSSGNSLVRSAYNQTPPEGVEAYNGNWITDSSFGLNEQDPYVKTNMEKTIGKWIPYQYIIPPIILILYFIFVGNIFYEAFIPIFECMNMTDDAFFITDQLVYYFPILLIAIAIILLIVLTDVRRKKERAFCKQVVEYYRMLKTQKEVELETIHKMNNMEFYEECPNCGAPVKHGSLNCEYCDSSLVKEKE